MSKRFRTLAMIAACVLALIMLFSVFYIALEADHDCHGEDCAVCAVLTACESFLRQMTRAAAIFAAAALCLCAVSAGRTFFIHRTPGVTLITLKVKFSN